MHYPAEQRVEHDDMHVLGRRVNGVSVALELVRAFLESRLETRFANE